MLESPRPEKVTTAALAARLDVSEAALYRHFASKAQMYEGLIEFIETTLFTLVNRIAGETQDGVAQAQQIVGVLLGFAEKNPGMTRVLIGDALVNEDERLQARMNQLYERIEAALRQALRIAQASGSWHGDPNADANVLVAYVLGRWQLFAKSGFKRSPAGELGRTAQVPVRVGAGRRGQGAADLGYGMRPQRLGPAALSGAGFGGTACALAAVPASGARRTGYDDLQTGHCGSRGMRMSRQRMVYASSSSSRPVIGSPTRRDELQDFGGLRRADDPDDRGEDAHDRAARLLELLALAEQAVVAGRGRVARVEHGDLSVEADRGAGDQRLSGGDAGAVHGVARREVVAAVDDDVGALDQSGELAGRDARPDRFDAHVRVDRRKTRLRRDRPSACRRPASRTGSAAGDW